MNDLALLTQNLMLVIGAVLVVGIVLAVLGGFAWLVATGTVLLLDKIVERSTGGPLDRTLIPIFVTVFSAALFFAAWGVYELASI